MAATALAAVSGRRNGMAATPLLPPRSPVPLDVHLVNRRPLTARSGESTAAGHGAWPPVTLFRPAVSPQADPSRPSRDQRPGLEVTPSRGYFAKESLDFSKS